MPPTSFSQGMKLSARAVQVQQQRMSQQQIMSLNVLAMPSLDLRDEIYTQAAKNPALEIVRDSLETGAKTAREGRSRFSDNTRYGSVTQAGELASGVGKSRGRPRNLAGTSGAAVQCDAPHER